MRKEIFSYFYHSNCLGGGIGRRAGFKTQYLTMCGFDSRPRYKAFLYWKAFLIMTYFVYAISSLSRPYIYVGLTFNVIDRFQTHQKRLNATTKPYAPFLLIYTEECLDRKEARRREKYWKGGSGKRKLKLLKSKFM